MAWTKRTQRPPADTYSQLARAVDAVYAAIRASEVPALGTAIDELTAGIGRLPDDEPNIGVYQAVLGFALARRYRFTGEVEDLRAGIDHGELALDALPADDPQRHKVLLQLSNHYVDLFRVDDELSDLDAAIELAEEHLELAPQDDPELAEKLYNLAVAYRWRHERTGDVDDHDSMLELCEEALTAPAMPGVRHGDVRAWLRNGYFDRYLREGVFEDLDTAARHGERCLAETAADDPERVPRLFLLALVYQHRFDLTGDLADADSMARRADAAVALGDPEAPSWPSLLAMAAEGHRRKFDRLGTRADLDAAIDGLERAVAALDPDDQRRARWQANAGLDHLARFRLTGDEASLRTAVDRLESACAAIPEDHPDHIDCQGKLAMAYQARFELTRDDDDLAASITLNERVVAGTEPAEGGAHVPALVNLAADLLERYHHLGDPADLDTAIGFGQRALPLLPETGADRSACLSNVAVGHRRRYDRFGAGADLDAAIVLGEQAVAALPDDHPQRPPRLGNLALAHAQRFRRTGSTGDLDTAIEHGGLAVAGLPDTGDRARFRLALGVHHRERFVAGGDPEDLARAVELAEQGLAGATGDTPEWAEHAAALAGALLARYRHAGEQADLDAAIDTMERAAAVHGSVNYLGNLAIAYGEKADRLPDGTVERLVEGVLSAADDVLASELSAAQQNVGTLALRAGEPTAAARVLAAAVRALPRCAPRGLEWSDQEFQLAPRRGLVGDAIAAQLAAGDVEGALELAELGRGVLLGNQLDARAGTGGLAGADPELAAEFDRVRAELDLPRPPELDTVRAAAWLSRRRAAAGEWDELLDRIRALPDFANFLAPPRARDLRAAATGGTVVLVSVGHTVGHTVGQPGGDAILVRPDGLTHLPLPGLDAGEVRARVATLTGVTVADEGGGSLTRPVPADPGLLSWLWETITGPVLDALGHTEPSDEPPRVWWVPTGLLGLLPLHAAERPGGPSALDRVTSSYAPTVRSLLHARARPAGTGGRLTVAMRHTAGLPDLPGTTAEAEALRTRHPDTVALADATATAGAVLAALPAASVAHFACHATSDPAASAGSGLHLHDALLTVPEVARLRLSGAELAYLSACSTGRGGVVTADEAIHLGSAFQLAGFRHVVATLWPVSDAVAASAAQRFHELRDQDVPPAQALHRVARRLRAEHPRDPRLWAPFVHSGP